MSTAIGRIERAFLDGFEETVDVKEGGKTDHRRSSYNTYKDYDDRFGSWEIYSFTGNHYEIKPKNGAQDYVPDMPKYHGVEIQRVDKSVLGYGVLGRTFPYLGIIQIRNDLYGDDFKEVLTHELVHFGNPHLTEQETRMVTRQRLAFRPKWH